MPSLRNKEVRGDHYVTLVIQVPDKLSSEAKDLIRRFDAETGNTLSAAKDAISDAEEVKDKKKKFWK